MNFSYNATPLVVIGCILSEGLLGWLLRGNTHAFHLVLERLIGVTSIFIGLLLYSKLARCIGVFGIGVSACMTVWAIIGGIISPTPAISAVPIILRAAIYVNVFFALAAVYALLFSKTFSNEFSTRREKAPNYDLSRKLVLTIMAISLSWYIAGDINALIAGNHS